MSQNVVFEIGLKLVNTIIHLTLKCFVVASEFLHFVLNHKISSLLNSQALPLAIIIYVLFKTAVNHIRKSIWANYEANVWAEREKRQNFLNKLDRHDTAIEDVDRELAYLEREEEGERIRRLEETQSRHEYSLYCISEAASTKVAEHKAELTRIAGEERKTFLTANNIAIKLYNDENDKTYQPKWIQGPYSGLSSIHRDDFNRVRDQAIREVIFYDANVAEKITAATEKFHSSVQKEDLEAIAACWGKHKIALAAITEVDKRYSKLSTTRREGYLAAKESANIIRQSIIDEENARIIRDDESWDVLGKIARQEARETPEKVKYIDRWRDGDFHNITLSFGLSEFMAEDGKQTGAFQHIYPLKDGVE